jgi:hypothetical protein
MRNFVGLGVCPVSICVSLTVENRGCFTACQERVSRCVIFARLRRAKRRGRGSWRRCWKPEGHIVSRSTPLASNEPRPLIVGYLRAARTPASRPCLRRTCRCASAVVPPVVCGEFDVHQEVIASTALLHRVRHARRGRRCVMRSRPAYACEKRPSEAPLTVGLGGTFSWWTHLWPHPTGGVLTCGPTDGHTFRERGKREQGVPVSAGCTLPPQSGKDQPHLRQSLPCESYPIAQDTPSPCYVDMAKGALPHPVAHNLRQLIEDQYPHAEERAQTSNVFWHTHSCLGCSSSRLTRGGGL